MNRTDQANLVFLARNLEHRYALDQYEDKALASLLATVDKARRRTVKDIRDLIESGSFEDMEDAARASALLKELNNLTFAVRNQLTGDIADAAAYAGEVSFAAHNDIVSFGGLAPGFDAVSMSAAQIRAMVADTPLGGKLLSEWVDTAYSTRTADWIKQSLDSGLFRGASTREIVDGIADTLDLSRRDIITLTRTYVQSVNTTAMEAVYNANKDIISRVRWTATMEAGYKSSGGGTCLACAALDGKEWATGEQHPAIPLHPRCRCVLVPVTKTWRELGLDADEFDDAARPYTVREPGNIDEGGRRSILEVGFHDGDYASWFEKQGADIQRQILGPGRFALSREPGFEFGMMVSQDGRLRTIKEIASLLGLSLQ